MSNVDWMKERKIGYRGKLCKGNCQAEPGQAQDSRMYRACAWCHTHKHGTGLGLVGRAEVRNIK
jgi:hypothetical protein